MKILACQIIGPAAAGSAGPVPTALCCRLSTYFRTSDLLQTFDLLFYAKMLFYAAKKVQFFAARCTTIHKKSKWSLDLNCRRGIQSIKQLAMMMWQ